MDVRNLSKVYSPAGTFLRRLTGTKSQKLFAVDGVSLAIHPGEVVGLVGESGSGKTTLGRALLRLVEPTEGQILFRGDDLMTFSKTRMRETRRHLQMIFQDPYSSLNPRMTVRDMLAESLRFHGVCPASEADSRVTELLELVGLNAGHADRYPRDFSGGQRQRIGIARALSVKPAFIVADEPVSAVDVSIQAQIMNLLLDLRDRFDLTMLFIAHDLSVVRYVSTRVGVMYLGRIVELAPRRSIFATPRHPYTQGLLRAAPRPDPAARSSAVAIAGEPPSALSPPPGCHFHTRCPHATSLCREARPPLATVASDHHVACHHHEVAADRWSGYAQQRH
ncbi:MAG: ABC transporter ATP-binding protein [Alphaproteobacteria bacterium]|nr:ABC transporter ATP-binding protein [Alphaproteobacteria bacterium]